MKKKLILMLAPIFFLVNEYTHGVDYATTFYDFQRLATPYGITIRMSDRIKSVGKQGTQEQFNAVRNTLNKLFKTSILTDNIVNQILDNINKLKSLNPSRRPQSEDYQKLLDARLMQRTPADSQNWQAKFAAVQKEFIALQKKFGIITSSGVINRILKGRAGDPKQLIEVRKNLNQLLSKEIFTDADVTQAQKYINQLNKLNPQRWPRAQDYQQILDLRK